MLKKDDFINKHRDTIEKETQKTLVEIENSLKENGHIVSWSTFPDLSIGVITEICFRLNLELNKAGWHSKCTIKEHASRINIDVRVR